MKNTRRRGLRRRTIALAIVMSAIVGTAALATDVGLLYLRWARLQSGVDSAALAGAGYLPEDPGRARQAALVYAQANGIREAELAGAPVIASDGSTITVTARLAGMRGLVRAVGLYSGSATASATAEAPYAAGVVGGGNGTRGNPSRALHGSCSTIGQCDLLPIGLDYRTPYARNRIVTLKAGADGWSLLGLDGAAHDGSSGVADGYPGPLAIGEEVSAGADGAVDAAAQGLRARIAAGRAKFPAASFSSHDPVDPRAVIAPMVDWDSATHQGKVRAFAALWVDAVSGDTIEAHFIDQVAYDSPPDPNAPFRGARGRPILVR